MEDHQPAPNAEAFPKGTPMLRQGRFSKKVFKDYLSARRPSQRERQCVVEADFQKRFSQQPKVIQHRRRALLMPIGNPGGHKLVSPLSNETIKTE